MKLQGVYLFRNSLRMFNPIAVCALLVATAGCGDVGSDNATMGEPAAKGAQAAKFKVGDTVNFDAFEVTLKSVEELSSVGNQYTKTSVAEGGTYVAIVYSLKNTGTKPIGMFGGPTLKLMDPSGTTYDSDVGASSSFSSEKEFNRKVVSDLNPGIKVNDGKVWEVSKEQFDRAKWSLVLDGHENTPISLN